MQRRRATPPDDTAFRLIQRAVSLFSGWRAKIVADDLAGSHAVLLAHSLDTVCTLQKGQNHV
jgi:hypothetical protein